MVQKEKMPRQIKAQAVIEIAIFGSIVIFLIGAIVQQAAGASFQQYFALRTFREAMGKAASEIVDAAGRPYHIRKAYSLMVIEDRLSPGVSKYGAIQRTPYIASANGSLSKDLFYALDYGNTEQLPELHIRINGEMFGPFKTAGWGEPRPCPASCRTREAAKVPGTSPSWKWVDKPAPETAKMMQDVADGGAASCDIDGVGRTYRGSSSPVYDEETILKKEGNTCYYLDSHGGDFDPSNPDHGLQLDMEIRTDVDATLTVNPDPNVVSTPSKTQTDVIRRKFVGNNGTQWLESTITRRP